MDAVITLRIRLDESWPEQPARAQREAEKFAEWLAVIAEGVIENVRVVSS